MVELTVDYAGSLRCEARHGPSGATLTTDAPVDNHGKGEAFSPTDLLATALGSCLLTVMAISADRHGWDVTGARAHVTKHMTQNGERRVERLEVRYSLPESQAARLSLAERQALERIAHTCPVRLSLLPAIEVPMHFSWGGPE